MKNYFSYEVTCYDTDDYEIGEQTFIGVTYGEDYQEALSNICAFYGEGGIVSVRMEAWDAEGCLEISASALEDMRERLV